MKKRTARFWKDELAAEAADSEHQIGGEKWRKEARKCVDRYRDKRGDRNSGKRFNIFWSNVETLKPTIYSQTPNPDVRRRFMNDDKVARQGALILERGLSFALDDFDADEVFEGVRDDGLIAGRGQAWVEYEPYMRRNRPQLAQREAFPGSAEITGEMVDFYELDGREVKPDGEDKEGPYLDEKIDERVWCSLVGWDDFRHTPVANWSDVWWVARRHRMDKDECKDAFGSLADKIPYDVKAPGEDNKSGGKAEVWEVWDKKTRKVYWVHNTWAERVLKEADDPLNLEGFFPCPEPYTPIRVTDDWTPVPEFTLYADQADEIDEISHRIAAMVKAFRARGGYDGALKEIPDILRGDDLELVPINDMERYLQKGGLPAAVMWLPLDMLGQAIAALYQARDQSKQELYEITGISDLVRGATKASETATAQQLKGNFGNLRMQPRTKPFTRFVRDILRIMAEIMSEHYSPETLQRMTGFNLPTPQEKAQLEIQERMAQASQQGMTAPPEAVMQ